jgi:hypothetical protein
MDTNKPMKQKYLVVYDYGMGGVWAFITARSKDDILTKFPELTIVDKPPFSMSEEHLRAIEKRSSFDIDDEPPKWLKISK